MPFIFVHEFSCQACRYVHEVTTKGHAMTEPPLLPGGIRALHCEVVAQRGTQCLGLMRYVRSRVLPPEQGKLLNAALNFMQQGEGQPSKLECEQAIERAWQAGIAKGKFHEDQELPEDLWEDVQLAQKRLNDEAAARRPQNARQALDKIIGDGAGRDGRTLAVAFNRTTKDWVTGYSGGQGGVRWSRRGGGITVDAFARELAPLVEALNGTTKQPALGREVWVCAEVDAAAKALKSGWRLQDLSFDTAEYPDGTWRYIQACEHCEQWC